MTALLSAANVKAGYKGHPFVHDLDLSVSAGEVVALLGPNGAGKTTTLLTLCGELPVIEGEVQFEGKSLTGPLYARARAGISFVSEERSVFMRLTVAENLRVGRCDTERVLTMFPELRQLLDRRVGKLSGGEQQMLTLGRALARSAKLLMIDELSLGLAPLIVDRLLNTVRAAADAGLGVLLVEQHVEQALKFADSACVMRRGRVVLSGPSDQVAGRVRELEESYLAADGQS